MSPSSEPLPIEIEETVDTIVEEVETVATVVERLVDDVLIVANVMENLIEELLFLHYTPVAMRNIQKRVPRVQNLHVVVERDPTIPLGATMELQTIGKST